MKHLKTYYSTGMNVEKSVFISITQRVKIYMHVNENCIDMTNLGHPFGVSINKVYNIIDLSLPK